MTKPAAPLTRPVIPSSMIKSRHEEEIISACPLQAGPLHTTLRDLALCKFARCSYRTIVPCEMTRGMELKRLIAVEWHDLRVLELEGTGWAIILGHKRREVSLCLSPPLVPKRPSRISMIRLSLSSDRWRPQCLMEGVS